MASKRKIRNVSTLGNESEIRHSEKMSGTRYEFETYSRKSFYKKIYYSIICLVLILLFLIGDNGTVVQAKSLLTSSPFEQIDSCAPVDLVFVVDQSEEMNKLDPNGMRIDAIKWMINFMGYDQILHCPNITHRVKVIGFNNEQSEDMPLESISPAMSSSEPWRDWEDKYQELTSSLLTHNSGARDFSSLKKALENATENLPAIGTGERKKVIVLIIGGGGSWCPDQYCDEYRVNGPNGQERELSEMLRDADMDEFSFWAIVYGRDVRYSLTQFWEETAKEHGGILYNRGTGNIETGKTLKEIFLNVSPRLDSDIKEICGPFYIDPLLEKAGFNILLENAEKKVKIRTANEQLPDDILASSTQGTTLLYKTNLGSPLKELYYLYGHPEPGLWEVEVDCNNKKALVVAQFARATRISIVEPHSSLPQFKEDGRWHNPDDPHYLKFQIMDAQGSAVREYQPYAAFVTGMVRMPDGSEPYQLTFRYEDNLYISNEPLPVIEEGDYKVDIHMQIPSANPDLSDQYTNIISEGIYSVAPLTPFVIQIESPTPSDHVSVHGNLFDHWLNVKPIEVRVRLQLKDTDDPVTSSSQMLKGDPKKAVEVILYHPSSGGEEKVWLEPSSTDPLLFVGNVGNKLISTGEYSIKASFVGQYDAEKYYPLQNPTGERLEFRRIDGPFESPFVYYLLMSILAFVVAFLAGLEVYKRTNTATGYLLFVPPGKDMKPFTVLDLSEQKKRKVFYSKAMLQKHHWLLSNLESITVNSPSLIGNTQQVIIAEANVEKDLNIDERSENAILMTSTKQYQIVYSKKRPPTSQSSHTK